MIALTKRLSVIGMASGLLMLLIMVFMQSGITYAASQINSGSQATPNTLQLHGSAGMSVHAQSGTTVPVVSTNGHTVNITLNGTTYVVTNQNDIQNNWLDVTVPANLNLDLQVQNGTIQIDGVKGQMQLTTENGTIIIANSTLAGTSNVSTKNGYLQLDGKLESLSKSSFTAVYASIQVTLPTGTKLHLHAEAQVSGNLTGNFSGLPNNAPRTFDGYLNASAGDPGLADLSLTTKSGSLVLNQK